MAIIDKKAIFKTIEKLPQVELELGCGGRKRNRNAIGIDVLDSPDVDIVGDVYDVLDSFPAESVDSVSSYHFVEHIPDLPKLLGELARVVKPEGHVEFVAPHFSNPYFYSDPTHRNSFGLYTFCYFASNSPFSRTVPTYGFEPRFALVGVDLIFKSARPFYLRHAIRRVVGSIFNSCNYLRELYEENFCYIIPCYEIRYRLRRQTTKT